MGVQKFLDQDQGAVDAHLIAGPVVCPVAFPDSHECALCAFETRAFHLPIVLHDSRKDDAGCP